MRDICIDRYQAFGTAGNAARIKVMTLEQMAHKYARGELAQQVK